MPNILTETDARGAGWQEHPMKGFMDLAGPLWSRQENGERIYGCFVGTQHLNRGGVVHGGMLVTLIDQALSLLAWETSGRQPCVTVQLDTHFLSSVRAGAFIEARGRIMRRTASLVFLQGSLSVDSVEILAASAILKLLAKRSPS